MQCTFDLAHSHTVLYISAVPPPTHSTHRKCLFIKIISLLIWVGNSLKILKMLIIDLVTSQK